MVPNGLEVNQLTVLDIIVVVFIYEGKGKVGVVVDNFFRLDKKKKDNFFRGAHKN